MHAAWDRVYRVWKWEDERRRDEMLELEATSTRRYVEVENIETLGGGGVKAKQQTVPTPTKKKDKIRKKGSKETRGETMEKSK